ncbi:MAG: hypothetical protein IJE91_04825 [Clostridia bacterium]|nr:hypothetical protein [Clostridia bacterium]
MGKFKEIIYVVCVVAVLIAVSLILGFSGTKNAEYNYVKLEINPALEFLCDGSGKVVTMFPVNAEAKELIIAEQFVGLKAEDASKKFVDLCVQAGYIDVDRQDNAVKLTIITGLTEMLDVKIYNKVSSYLLENQIKAVIVENESDLEEFKEAKKYGVSSNKFSLMESVSRLYPDIEMDSLKKLSKKELIKKIKTAHQNLFESVVTYTPEQLANKTKLIDFNRAKLNNHKELITKTSKSEFADEYKQFVKLQQKYYEQNFNKQHEMWKANKINSSIA